MLDDDAGRALAAKLRDQLQRGIGIVVIIVAELLALDLACLGDAAGVRAGGDVERCLLVRVFSVTQLFPGGITLFKGHLILIEKVENGRVVMGRSIESLGSESFPVFQGSGAIAFTYELQEF